MRVFADIQAIAKQVLVGEFILYKPVHANITNAVTTSLHFIIDGLAAFIVAILVYVVRALQHHNLLNLLNTTFVSAKRVSCPCIQACISHCLWTLASHCLLVSAA